MSEPAISEDARKLLLHIVTVQEWAKAADIRADPYIAAGAVILLDRGGIGFHREKFIAVMTATGDLA